MRGWGLVAALAAMMAFRALLLICAVAALIWFWASIAIHLLFC